MSKQILDFGQAVVCTNVVLDSLIEKLDESFPKSFLLKRIKKIKRRSNIPLFSRRNPYSGMVECTMNFDTSGFVKTLINGCVQDASVSLVVDVVTEKYKTFAFVSQDKTSDSLKKATITSGMFGTLPDETNKKQNKIQIGSLKSQTFGQEIIKDGVQKATSLKLDM